MSAHRLAHAWRCAALGLLVLAIGGGPQASAQRTAAVRLPSELGTDAVQLRFEGFGGRNRGEFVAGDFHGDFVRLESRLAVFDPGFVSNRGKGSFTLAGPGIDAAITADCSFRENVVTIKVVTVETRRFGYVCELTDAAGTMRGTTTLVEPKRSGFRATVVARSDRVGEAMLGGAEVELRSIHEYDGSRLIAQTPAGYLLSIGGRPLAALELTDTDPVLILGTMPDEVPVATVVAVALSLAVLRDPANSALDD
jgi:hypothetical protein